MHRASDESGRRRLSKLMSLMLRHQPGRYGLTLDADGFVRLADFVEALQHTRGNAHVTEDDVRAVVATSDKQRFEIAGERIRARYGHSVPDRVTYDPVEPPAVLYHGTSPEALPAIRSHGLQPMRRQYVHLSTSPETAYSVGRRHHAQPVMLSIRAHDAWRAGVLFFQPEARLFLSPAVPPQFVDEVREP